jgi:hypothetical protein
MRQETMEHLTDDDLVLLHYGEPAEPDRMDAATHTAACEACRQRLEDLSKVLGAVDLPVPDPDRFFEARVWRAVEPRLAPRAAGPRRGALRHPHRLALAASLLLLVLASYLAGQWRGRAVEDASIPEDVRQRVLQVAVLDHLERGRHLLTDLLNENGAGGEPASGDAGPAASQPVDMAVPRGQAETLVAAGRIYRQSAAAAEQAPVVAVLDDLERVLLEVAHTPEVMPQEELDALRRRLRGNGILLKVQMMATSMRGTRPQQPPQPGRAGHRI